MNEELEPDPMATMELRERAPKSGPEWRILEFTIQRTRGEYVAEAMLLGMNYGYQHHLYTLPDKVLDPDILTELPIASVIYVTRIKRVARIREERGELEYEQP